MVVASAPGASGVPHTRIRRHVVVWWAALIASSLWELLSLAPVLRQGADDSCNRSGHARHLRGAVELSQAFLELALHENDTDGTSHRRALALIGAGQAAIASAITLAQPSAVPDDVRQRLSSFQRRLATLANGRLAELSSDQELAPEFEQLNIEIGELDQRAEDLLLIATLQLDDLLRERPRACWCCSSDSSRSSSSPTPRAPDRWRAHRLAEGEVVIRRSC